VDNKTQETMAILAEECAEVIQAVSKINRFGLDNLKPGKPKTNRQHLEEELGDMMAMITILIDKGIVDPAHLKQAEAAKIEKLKLWSNIFTEIENQVKESL
jgi:NTP pyrophosphatase (non-canonical NTP hydrolase)